MILHFDVETAGFPVPGVPADDPRHPSIVSLSAVLDDEKGVLRRVMSVIVRQSVPIDERLVGDDGKTKTAFAIHGITNAVADKYGVPLSSALIEFADMAQCADAISAFNVHFDWKLIKIACARSGPMGEQMRAQMEAKQSICAMENAAGHLIGKKRISLKNAYFDMFKEEIQLGYHGSLEDVMASRRVYSELVRRGHQMERNPLLKEYATPYVATA